MKKFTKPNLLPFLALGVGTLGLFAQIWLYSTGVDEKGLFIRSHPANYLLLILTLLVPVGLFLLVGNADLKKLRRADPRVCALGSFAAAAGILYAALRDLAARPNSLIMFCAIAGLFAAAGLLHEALQYLNRRRPSIWLRCILVVYLILNLLCRCRQWSARPQLQDYCFLFLAAVFLLFAAYHRAALEIGMGQLRRYLFFCYTALFFCCLSLINGGWRYYLPMAVWAAANTSPRRGSPVRQAKPTAMALPENVQTCITLLEQAGYAAYAVGGCVRDALLGLTPHDYDLCTPATPEEICRVFSKYQLVRSGEKHGTIGVVMDGTVYEITTFRVEGGYTDGRHPDWVAFVPSLEEDLKRRDFTVNAIAYSPSKGFIDPLNGRADLNSRILRAVGDPQARFREDALRILRGVRFASRYQLTPEPETEGAMAALAPLMDGLARERVYDELCKLLVSVTAEELIRYAPVITQAIPELGPAVGFDQHSPHHAFDVYTHTACVVESVPPQLALKWAALLHDVGKPATFTQDENGRGHFYGHDRVSADMANEILLRLKAPTALRERVVFLVRMHMTPLAPDKPTLRRRLGTYGEAAIRQLLLLQRADLGGKAPGTSDDSLFEELKQALAEVLQENTALSLRDLAVNGRDLQELGFAPGPQIGACLDALLTGVQEERLANTREALLAEAERLYKENEEAE